jgi:putative mRNA 3-end processing factor
LKTSGGTGTATEILYEHGIKIKKDGYSVTLDPKRKSTNTIVSHAHTDHLARDGIMTQPTRDIMKDAGHVLGSAMVRVDDILYTGDFNPEGGLTCGKAVPEKCRTLIIESTYGKPSYSLPEKDAVVKDFMAWISSTLEKDTVIIGGYEFGKAQEVISLCNTELKSDVYVTSSTARICDIYIKHGVNLKYRILPDNWFETDGEPKIIVVPSGWLRFNGQNFWQVHKEKKRGAKTCYVSGWCAFYGHSGYMSVDSEFPLSDHADYDDIIEFVAKCSPEKVYTVYGSNVELAKGIKRETGIESEPLGK